MNKKLTKSAKDEKVPLPAAVRGSKTPVLKLSNVSFRGRGGGGGGGGGVVIQICT